MHKIFSFLFFLSISVFIFLVAFNKYFDPLKGGFIWWYLLFNVALYLSYIVYLIAEGFFVLKKDFASATVPKGIQRVFVSKNLTNASLDVFFYIVSFSIPITVFFTVAIFLVPILIDASAQSLKTALLKSGGSQDAAITRLNKEVAVLKADVKATKTMVWDLSRAVFFDRNAAEYEFKSKYARYVLYYENNEEQEKYGKFSYSLRVCVYPTRYCEKLSDFPVFDVYLTHPFSGGREKITDLRVKEVFIGQFKEAPIFIVSAKIDGRVSSLLYYPPKTELSPPGSGSVFSKYMSLYVDASTINNDRTFDVTYSLKESEYRSRHGSGVSDSILVTVEYGANNTNNGNHGFLEYWFIIDDEGNVTVADSLNPYP